MALAYLNYYAVRWYFSFYGDVFGALDARPDVACSYLARCNGNADPRMQKLYDKYRPIVASDYAAPQGAWLLCPDPTWCLERCLTLLEADDEFMAAPGARGNWPLWFVEVWCMLNIAAGGRPESADPATCALAPARKGSDGLADL